MPVPPAQVESLDDEENISGDSGGSDDSGEENWPSETGSTSLGPAPKKTKRGQYRSYSQFNTSILLQMAQTPVSVLSERYSIPRSTIFSWENQMRMMDKTNVAGGIRGKHLRAGSG